MTDQPSSYTAVICPQCGASLHESGDPILCPYCPRAPGAAPRVTAGWGYQGSVEWLDNPAQVARIHFRVGNPGGVEAWEMFPMDCFGWTSDPMLQRSIPRGGNFYGEEFQPPADALDVLDDILLPRYRSGEDVEGLDMRLDEEATRRAADEVRAKSAREDVQQDERVRTIRGTDLYHDPAREKDVELEYGHRQVWSNGSGEYILSDDANDDPNVGGTGNWSQIDPARNT